MGDGVSVLPKEELDKRLDHTDLAKRLVVTPMLDRAVQMGPGSIDLRLGTDFLLPRLIHQSGIDPGDEDAQMEVDEAQERIVLPLGESLWLHPQQLVLGSTLEFVRLPTDCAAYVLGRSSWGRIGLLVATAVAVHPGYAGSLTLELVNEGNTPIKLWPGLRVAQLVVDQMDIATTQAHPPRFFRAIGPQPAKLGWDHSEVEKLSTLKANLSGSAFVTSGE